MISSEGGRNAIHTSNRWYALRLANHVPSVIRCVRIDSRRRVWIGGEGGVACLTQTDAQEFGPVDGVPKGVISDLFEDSRQRIWISSWGDNIAYLAGRRWRRLTEADGLCHRDVNGFSEDSGKRLWIGTDRGVSVYSRNQFLKATAIEYFRDLNVKSITSDGQGRILLGTVGGLLVIDADGKLDKITVDDGLPQQTPQTTLVDTKGRIWVGTWGGGIALIDPGSLRPQRHLAAPQAEMVGRLCEDRAGTIWAGSLASGVWRLAAGENAWRRLGGVDGVTDVRFIAAIPDSVATRLMGWAS